MCEESNGTANLAPQLRRPRRQVLIIGLVPGVHERHGRVVDRRRRVPREQAALHGADDPRGLRDAFSSVTLPTIETFLIRTQENYKSLTCIT